jgi:hypothetical protein
MQAKTLLRLKDDLMNSADPAALELLEICWETAGYPQEERKLIAVLKDVIDRCSAKGIVYPRILVKRKGELARGEFELRTKNLEMTNHLGVEVPAHLQHLIKPDWIEAANRDFQTKLQSPIKRGRERD